MIDMSDPGRPRFPHRHNQIVDDVLTELFGKDNKVKAETAYQNCLRKGAELNKRVQDRLAPETAEWNKHPLTTPPAEELFVKLHHYYLDDLKTFKMSYDELVFLFAFNCAKILHDQLKGEL